MPRGSPSRSRTDYTAYEFTASAGFDYNYDPVGGRSSLHSNYLFDPYTDDYPSSPLIYQQDYNNPKGYDTSYDHVEPRYQYHRDTYSADTAVSYSRPEITPRPAPTPKVITEKYIRESEEPSQRIEDPTSCRKLLVLDLNGTLLFRSPHVRREYKARYRRGFRGSNYHGHTPHLPDPDPYADPTTLRPLRSVYARPYLTSFRQYLFHPSTRLWLDTMVWSSAQPHSVTDMVEKCFGEKKDDLVAIWARDTLGLEEKDYHRKTQTTKDLAKPWATLPLSPPDNSGTISTPPTEKSQLHSARTTLLLDDSPLKAHLQPWNHLCIQEYVAELRNADLAFRESEKRRLDAADESQHTHEEDASTASDSPLAETDVNTEVRNVKATSEVPGTEVDVMTTNKKKRKRPKKSKRESSTVPNYDETLLAVIGILDHIRCESNVAGWMRSGGLCSYSDGIPKAEKGKGKEKDEGIEQEGEEHTQTKRVRLSVETNKDNDISLPPPPSPPAAPSPEIASELTLPPVMPREATSSTDGASRWYEDKLTMSCWVTRGIQALDKLGVELISGVDD